jgi:hypothetical protein
MYDSELSKPGVASLVKMSEPPGFAAAEAEALADWSSVCTLPSRVLKDFGYEPDGKRSGVGFEVKDGAVSSDRKMDMHLTLKAQAAQIARARQVDESGRLEKFILSAGRLILAAKPAVLEYARLKAEEMGEPEYVDHVLDALDEWMLRGLCYPPGIPAGSILAAGHCDKGDFTLDGRADHGRMEYLPRKDPLAWAPVELLRNEVAFMPGISLQARSDSLITAAAHRVMATEDSERYGRKVLVIFVDSLHSWYFKKDEYGSQQQVFTRDFGWNYDMPPKEFRSRFRR